MKLQRLSLPCLNIWLQGNYKKCYLIDIVFTNWVNINIIQKLKKIKNQKEKEKGYFIDMDDAKVKAVSVFQKVFRF